MNTAREDQQCYLLTSKIESKKKMKDIKNRTAVFNKRNKMKGDISV